MNPGVANHLKLAIADAGDDILDSTVFIAAGILAIISVLLLLVGFVAELIVSQGARIAYLEREIQAMGDERQRGDG